MPINGIRLLAHRGARLTSPENTLESLARAKAEGADGIEFDVRLSSDGEPFLFHDESTRRVAGGNAQVSRLSWREIRRLRVFGVHPIPHLEEVLRAMEDWPKAELYIDLHQRRFDLAETVARGVQASLARDRTFVLDFYTGKRFLRRVVETAPRVRISVMPGPPWWIDRSCDLGAGALCVGLDGALTKRLYRLACRVYDARSAIRRAQERGIRVSGGVANAAEEVRWLVGQGVDAIWTDDLASTRRVLGEGPP